MKVLVAQSSPTLCDPITVACQAPLPMEFSKQEYWSRLPFPSPGDLLDSRIEPWSPESSALAGRLLTASATWEVLHDVYRYQIITMYTVNILQLYMSSIPQ